MKRSKWEENLCIVQNKCVHGVVDRGFVTYTNEAKGQMLGVEPALLEAHGAVSEEVARAMAEGALKHSEAQISIAVTGIAGPGGGSEEKPVGTVHVALAGPAAGPPVHRLLRFPGDRDRVRRLTSQWSLDLLRKRLLAADDGAAPQ